MDFKEAHLKEIAAVLGEEGVWFKTEMLTTVRQK